MNAKRILPGNEEQPDIRFPLLVGFAVIIYMTATIYRHLVAGRWNFRVLFCGNKLFTLLY